MATLWFCIVAVMLAAYVVLDGFDIGAGIIHLVAARTDNDRRKILRSIGPVWDGNEVWLLAAGGALYFAFPQLYASSFSGFYLPLMIVLWLLMLRAIGLEFRSHLGETVWKQFLDAVFAVSSILLAIFYGAALGNVVRGVPLGADHYFFLPLFTNWRVGPSPGILDWYTVLSGVLALVALGAHGAHYVAVKTDGDLNARCRNIAKVLQPTLLVLTLLSLLATLSIRPELLGNYKLAPLGYIIPLGVFLSIAAMMAYGRKNNDKGAFLASSAYIVFMLVGAAFSLYPVILPATDPSLSLTIQNSVTSQYAMKVALAWWSFGIVIALGYFVFIYRMFKGKVSLEGSSDHGY
jgi:cytochrome bd ubiquinol oxidase subunit II